MAPLRSGGSGAQTRTPCRSLLLALPVGAVIHAMAYDDARQVVVLYGGYDGAGRLGDTWTWDGVSWTPQTVEICCWATCRQP